MADSWSLATVFERHARETPERTLATDGARTWSYGQVDADASALAVAFSELGLGAGDRIAVLLPNGIEWVTAIIAASRLGAVVVPVSPQLGVHDLRYQLRHAEASAVITIEQWNGVDYLQRFEGLLQDLPDLQYVVAVGGTDLWYEDRMFQFSDLVARGTGKEFEPIPVDGMRDLALMYTSGTMGKPKAVVLSHASVVGNAVLVAEQLGIRSDDRVLALVSFSAIYGLSAMVAALSGGASLVLIPAFDVAAALQLIPLAAVTVVLGVPSQFHMLMRDSRFDSTGLTTVRSGLMVGSAVDEALVRRVRRWCDVLVGYGLTETGGVVTMTRHDDSEERRLQTVGCPLPGVEVMAVDVLSGELHGPEAVGELAVRGSNVMKGYLRMPTGTARVLTPEGFFLTGDIGIIDEDGCVRILGRREATISRGGVQLYPHEIEDRLRAHPAVDDVCVIGIPHDVMGELMCACIVPVEGAVITGDEIKRFARDTMAADKVPDLVRFYDAFPMTGSGKIRRRELGRAITLSANAPGAIAR